MIGFAPLNPSDKLLFPATPAQARPARAITGNFFRGRSLVSQNPTKGTLKPAEHHDQNEAHRHGGRVRYVRRHVHDHVRQHGGLRPEFAELRAECSGRRHLRSARQRLGLGPRRCAAVRADGSAQRALRLAAARRIRLSALSLLFAGCGPAP